MFSDEEVTLTLYKETLRGVCQDYVIKFKREQKEIEKIIPLACDIVKLLVDELHQKEKTFKARLVALVHYVRKDSNVEVSVYHPSYKSEIIEDATDFFITHMLKIAQRMTDFNQKGSNLLIKSIDEIHLHVTCVN